MFRPWPFYSTTDALAQCIKDLWKILGRKMISKHRGHFTQTARNDDSGEYTAHVLKYVQLFMDAVKHAKTTEKDGVVLEMRWNAYLDVEKYACQLAFGYSAVHSDEVFRSVLCDWYWDQNHGKPRDVESWGHRLSCFEDKMIMYYLTRAEHAAEMFQKYRTAAWAWRMPSECRFDRFLAKPVAEPSAKKQKTGA